MPTESVSEDFEPTASHSALDQGGRIVACWPRVVMLTGALLGLLLARGIATLSKDPSDPGVKVATLAVVMLALTVMGLTITRLVTLTQSRRRHVFSSRHILACAMVLTVITAALAVSFLVVLDPFHGLAASGHIAATDIADAGWMFAVIVCGVGAGTALLTAWDASREERHWGDSLGIGR